MQPSHRARSSAAGHCSSSRVTITLTAASWAVGQLPRHTTRVASREFCPVSCLYTSLLRRRGRLHSCLCTTAQSRSVQGEFPCIGPSDPEPGETVEPRDVPCTTMGSPHPTRVGSFSHLSYRGVHRHQHAAARLAGGGGGDHHRQARLTRLRLYARVPRDYPREARLPSPAMQYPSTPSSWRVGVRSRLLAGC